MAVTERGEGERERERERARRARGVKRGGEKCQKTLKKHIFLRKTSKFSWTHVWRTGACVCMEREE